MIAIARIPMRLFRNPAKYCRTAFWKMLLQVARFRGRAALIYTLPSFVSSLVRGSSRVFIYPERMNRYEFAETYVAWKVFAALRLRPARTAAQACIAIAWHPTTSYVLDETPFGTLPAGARILNRRCTDIRKSVVGEVFGRVFGYRLEVDPCTYRGTMLRKSERNGAHDAQLVEGPIERTEPGYVYQRLITYRTPNGVAEWRVFIVGARPVAVYTLYAPSDDRFAYTRESAEMASLDDTFSTPEQNRIAAFCSEIGLDFGVLDILRDGTEDKIYVCDCNPTPTGPSPTLSIPQQLQLVHRLAREFKNAYLSARS